MRDTSTTGAPRVPGRALLPLVLLAVLGATLHPTGSEGAAGWDGCILCGDRGAADGVLNVLLFVPVGVVLAVYVLPGWPAVVAAALLSAAIELGQLWVPGRDPSPPDLLFNTLGAIVGVALARGGLRMLLPPPATAARLSAAAAVFALGPVALTGLLVSPDLPRSGYFGQWTPGVGRMEVYGGRVLDASAGGVAIPPARMREGGELRTALLAGAPLVVRMEAGPAPVSLAPLLRIADDREREILLLGAEAEDLVFRFRTRAVALQLDPPSLRARRALRAAPGDTVVVSVRPEGSRFALAVDGEEVLTGFTPSTGWELLASATTIPRDVYAWLRLAWMAALVLPLGLWARRRWETGVAALVLLLGLLVVPPLVGLTVPPTEALAAAAGIAAGAALRFLLVRARGVAPARHPYRRCRGRRRRSPRDSP